MPHSSFETLVLANIRDLRDTVDDIRRRQQDGSAQVDARIDAIKSVTHEQYTRIAVELAAVRMRASMLGLIAGALPGLAAIIWQLLGGHK